MPYTPEHKQQTRARIVECARQLFNRRGFNEVSIDDIMAAAGLTRGGFYNHFKTKGDLYVETLVDFAERREGDAAGRSYCGPELARRIFGMYVSRQHLDNLAGQCPLMAVPSDVARAGPAVRAAYQRVLEALASVFESNIGAGIGLPPRQHGLAVAATCVGAMVLARTIDDSEFADDICDAARAFADCALGWADGEQA